MIAVISAGIAAASPPTASAGAAVVGPATPAVAPLDPTAVQPAALTMPPLPPPPVVDPAVEIRDAFQAAQRLQGPLDGMWRLTDASGRPLLIFKLCDPGPAGTGAPIIEGAWRDPNRTGATDSSGFLEQIDRQGDGLSIRFVERDGDPPVVLTLHVANGEWRGDLSEQGFHQHVVMDPF